MVRCCIVAGSAILPASCKIRCPLGLFVRFLLTRAGCLLCSLPSILFLSPGAQENLSQALKEFKRDKISKQNARLSLVNSLYENPSMPRRKILLSVGANNYRPPMERSKSAPKLMSIEEAVGEEDDAAANGQARRHHTESVRSSTEYGLAAHRRHYRRNRTSAPLLPTDCDNTQISHTPNQWSRSISEYFCRRVIGILSTLISLFRCATSR